MYTECDGCTIRTYVHIYIYIYFMHCWTIYVGLKRMDWTGVLYCPLTSNLAIKDSPPKNKFSESGYGPVATSCKMLLVGSLEDLYVAMTLCNLVCRIATHTIQSFICVCVGGGGGGGGHCSLPPPPESWLLPWIRNSVWIGSLASFWRHKLSSALRFTREETHPQSCTHTLGLNTYAIFHIFQ